MLRDEVIVVGNQLRLPSGRLNGCALGRRLKSNLGQLRRLASWRTFDLSAGLVGRLVGASLGRLLAGGLLTCRLDFFVALSVRVSVDCLAVGF